MATYTNNIGGASIQQLGNFKAQAARNSRFCPAISQDTILNLKDNIMTVETLTNELNVAIQLENYELAGELKRQIEQMKSIVDVQETVDGAIETVTQSTNLDSFKSSVYSEFGQKTIKMTQTNPQPLFFGGPISSHYSVCVEHDNHWTESPVAVKEGYVCHDPVKMWNMMLDRVADNFELQNATIHCDNHKHGLLERVRIKNIGNPIELADDKIFPILDFWGGHGGNAGIQGNYGQDIFKCSNGLTIRSGKLAASFRKSHKGNLETEVDNLIVKFLAGVKTWQKQTDTFKRMDETQCPNYNAVIAQIIGIDAAEVLPTGSLTNNVSGASRNRYTAMLERLKKETSGDRSKVTNWRVAMAVHGYYNHKTNASGLLVGDDVKASDHKETKAAFELLAV